MVRILRESDRSRPQWDSPISDEIAADGDHFVMVLNGKTLLDGRDSKHASGGADFQCQRDIRIEFRNITLRPGGK